MLHYEADGDDAIKRDISFNDAMKGVKRPRMITKDQLRGAKKKILEKEQEIVGKVKTGGKALKNKFNHLKKGTAALEKELLESAWKEFVENLENNANAGSKEKKEASTKVEKILEQDKATGDFKENNAVKGEKKVIMEHDKATGGFVVLGMHRSGTSLLSGLLVQGFGYEVGEPLIRPGNDNEKGFFELLPAVLQNDAFMSEQGIDWATKVSNYDAESALGKMRKGIINFDEGRKALKFLNDKSKQPWIQKDPRMCITLQTWLPLLSTRPAVLFTYRHPMEVAMSLQKRQGFQLERGLKLWILYNRKAIENLKDLCYVLSSNSKILTDPMKEMNRIVSELTFKCNVPAAPQVLSLEVVDSFLDSKLQHNKKKLDEGIGKILETHDNCAIKDYDSDHKDGSPQKKSEMDLYLKAMKIFCDFEIGKAYEKDYEWPKLR